MGDGSLQLRKTGSQSLTTAPHTSAKCTLGSHDLRANCLRGSESGNGGSVAEGCGLLPRKQRKPLTQEYSFKVYQSTFFSPLPYSLLSCPPTLFSHPLPFLSLLDPSSYPPFSFHSSPFLPLSPLSVLTHLSERHAQYHPGSTPALQCCTLSLARSEQCPVQS